MAQTSTSNSNHHNMVQEVNEMELQIAAARKELQTLRDERNQSCIERSSQAQLLHSEYMTAKACLDKSLNQLNLSTYKHAVLKSQSSAVQPYMLQKLAVLCHALHHTEVVSKQTQLMQHSYDELETVLQNSIDQIEDFWEPRLLHLNESIKFSEHDIQNVASRFPEGAASILQQQQQQQQQQRKEEEEKECEEPSSSNAVLYSFLSMAMAAGRFHQASSAPRKVSRRQSMSFLPSFSQPKQSLEVTTKRESIDISSSYLQRRSSV